jgi:hypothetical protein
MRSLILPAAVEWHVSGVLKTGGIGRFENRMVFSARLLQNIQLKAILRRFLL